MTETPRYRRGHVKFQSTSKPKPPRTANAAGGPSAGRSNKPNIQVSRPEESVRFSRGLVLSVLLVIALVAAGVHAVSQRPDPHFVKASQILNDYEGNREEHARNYGSELYQEALDELALVDRDSVSFEKAQALSRDVTERRETFFVKVRQVERRKSELRRSKTERRADLAAKRAYSGANRQTEFPECDD